VWHSGRNARTVGVEAGQDLAHFVARRAGPELSIRKARTLIERGAVRVNGQVETFHSRILVNGDVVEAFIPDEGEHTFDPERVLMDRDGVIAYDKPAWLPVVRPDRKGSWSLFDILRQRWPELIAVHRLDEDTSGIVLFARTRTLADRLEKAFKDHAVSKEYLALVRGHPRDKGIHRSYLVMKAKTGGSERWESGRGQDAREAVTEWEVLSRVGTFASLVKVMPKTGRHHQIRIHFSEMGFPLYGDRRYGDRRDPVQVPRHMLHACRILLPHPAGGPAIDLTAPTPAEFGTAIGDLRRR
jgi:23S rRNA pseudouridine955/2504/2580 synthase/23S rRNA pseudouridine1911/1915/1917 synthase